MTTVVLARRRTAGIVLCLAALAIAGAASIAIGSRGIPLDEVVRVLVAPGDDEVTRIVRDLRIPRTVAAVAVGVGLGVAGGLIQALTRNPLGEPGLLGVNAGAGVAVTIGVFFFGTSSAVQDLAFAFVGALVVTAAVALIGSAGGVADPVRLTLAGVAVAAVLSGVMTGLVLLDPRAFDRLRGWEAGSLVGRDWDVLTPLLPFLAAGTIVAFALARPLNAMGLGDDLARSLGVRLNRTRVLSVVAITILAGAATAIAGPIAFVGLMAPHVARWIAGPDQRWIFALSLVIAPTVMLAADVVGRVALYPSELPVGIVSAFVGAPVLIALVRRAKASAL
ncbi:FecCD family ABC transporter permease [Microbacterium sp.]|uniref:FecCD family ABC transporter permease n=1 Tax=Microbacterium sp. TaxID=51671 RepID=UPI0039E2A884